MVNIYLENWRAKNSGISVLGTDGVWVNGISTRVLSAFNSNVLNHHWIINHFSIRFMLSFIAWVSIAYSITVIIWPFIVPFLREGVQMITLLIIIIFFGSFTVTWAIEYFLLWLFPRYELSDLSFPKKNRKWVWTLLTSSGIITLLIERIFFS
jgi:hypothetical protein